MKQFWCGLSGHDWRRDQLSNFMALLICETCASCGRSRNLRLLMHTEMEHLGWRWSK